MSQDPTPEQIEALKAAQARATDLKAKYRPLDAYHLDLLFREARSHNGWTGEPVTEENLRNLHDIARMGPTSMNCCPARFVFITTEEGKERIKPALAEPNVPKSMAAPVLVIIAHDMSFYEHFNKLMPFRDVRPMFENNAALASSTAFRNGTLQAAYFMLAARALGLDCGPMSGFDNAAVDQEFFAGTEYKSNFLCGLGHGDSGKLFPRLPRFEFEEVCQFA